MGGSGDCESGTTDELAVGEKRWCGLRRATRSARVRWRSCSRREEDPQCSQVSPVELLALALPARGHVGRGRRRGVPAGGARSGASRAAGGRVRSRAVPGASWAAWPSASGETRESEAEVHCQIAAGRLSLSSARSLAHAAPDPAYELAYDSHAHIRHTRTTAPTHAALVVVRHRVGRVVRRRPPPRAPLVPPASRLLGQRVRLLLRGQGPTLPQEVEPLVRVRPTLASLAPPATSGSPSASRATAAGLTPSAPTRTSTSSTAAGAGAAPTSTNQTSRAPAARSTRSTSTRTASSPRAASARSSSALPPLSARASARVRSAGDPRRRRPRRRGPRRREEQDRPRAATPSCTTRRPSPPRSRTRARARRRSRVRPSTGATSCTPVTGSAARPTSRSSTASRCVPRPRPLSPLLRARALTLEPSHAVHRRAGELLGREVRPLQALPGASPASRCGRRSPRAGP